MPDHDHHTTLAELQGQVRRLRATVVGLSLLVLTAVLTALAPDDDVLRVRGLVIEDGEGRERILIGAPLPHAAHRVRTDMEKVTAAWSDRFPHFDWYHELQHQTNGILILDENGHDRIAIGDPAPDPNVGRRIDTGPGMVINDEEGFERSGWSYFERLGRSGFGLDRQGGEGLNLMVDDGGSGILIRDGQQHSAYVGLAPSGSPWTGLAAPFRGLLVRDADEVKVRVDEQ